MEMTNLLKRAKQQLAEATGLKPEGVTRASKDNGGWRIGVEMLEMSRIPNSADVLGDYEAVLTDEGEMVKFERHRTRLRCETVVEERE